MKNMKVIHIFFMLIIVYLLSGYFNNRYYKIYPTLMLYPNNNKEVREVDSYIKTKNNDMHDFIKLTDPGVSYAFANIVDEDINYLKKMTQDIVIYIRFFKLIFNRARPFQVNPDLKKYNSISAFSPSFPSGHSAQAQYLAKRLSIKYPQKKKELYDLAEKCGLARIYAGLHYPSDHEFSKFLVSILP